MFFTANSCLKLTIMDSNEGDLLASVNELRQGNRDDKPYSCEGKRLASCRGTQAGEEVGYEQYESNYLTSANELRKLELAEELITGKAEECSHKECSACDGIADTFCPECREYLCCECTKHHRRIRKTKHHKLHVICSACDDIAETYCPECKEYLCCDCTKHHKRVRKTKNHAVRNINRPTGERRENSARSATVTTSEPVKTCVTGQETGAIPKIKTLQGTQKSFHPDDEDINGSYNDPNYEELLKIVVIEGIPQGTHKQDLELTFDTPSLGDGDIEEWYYDWLKDYGMVAISYKTKRAAESLLKKKTMTVSRVKVKLYSATEFDGYLSQQTLSTRAVRAMYNNDGLKLGVAELYFQSKKRGGGYIDQLFHDKKNKILYITFEDKEVAKRIAQKKQHIFDECHVTVTLMTAAPPTHHVRPPFEDKYLLVLHLPREVNAEDVHDFLDAKNGDRPKCFFSIHQGVALAKFKLEPDFNMLLAKCQEMPLKDRMIIIQRVSKVQCLQVLGIEGIDKWELELYFDSKSDDRVTHVTIYKKPELHAVVEFQEPKDVQELLNQQPFSYKGKTFTAELYFKECGLTKVCELSPWTPNDVSVQGMWFEVLEFVNHRSKLKGSIEHQMKEINAKVVWPSGKDTEVVLKYEENNPIPIDGWRKCATDTFCAQMQQFAFRSVQVLEMAWDDVQKRAKTLLNINTEEIVRADSRTLLIIITGMRNSVMITAEKIKKIVNEIDAEIERLKREIITEDMPVFKKYQVALLKAIPQFQAMLWNKNVTIDIAHDNSKISLKGLPNDIKKTKLAIYEILKEMETQFIPLKSDKLQPFELEQIKEHFSTLFKQHGLLVILEISNGKAFLHGVNRNTLDAAFVVMRASVKDKKIEGLLGYF